MHEMVYSFMTVKQTFKTEADVTKEYSGVGMFGTFLLFQRRLSSNRRSFLCLCSYR